MLQTEHINLVTVFYKCLKREVYRDKLFSQMPSQLKTIYIHFKGEHNIHLHLSKPCFLFCVLVT